ncbi:uncharacterized protein LOC133201564 [Saccostrea echinata]|uniref:uncharacterized protein LOC133201564 n=1 Tax=Saccostrea echinata TaxID=191078 RepID=UPI002A7FE605|nr:uncharacterized protein LOC133201564 [Saccostrea echinata]
MASKVSIISLVLIGITMTFWTVAMLTPGWLVVYITNELYPQGMKAAFSIFYYQMCYPSDQCKTDSLSFSKEDNSASSPGMPHFVEIQLEACFAIIVCCASFVLLLVNQRAVLPKTSRVVVGGILVFLGVVSESILVGRMINANLKTNDQFSQILENIPVNLPFIVDYRVGVQYSIILTDLGVITGIISCVALTCVYCRSRGASSEEHQVLEVYPPVTQNYQHLQESY